MSLEEMQAQNRLRILGEIQSSTVNRNLNSTVAYVQRVSFNSDGEVISESTVGSRYQNGSGFVISYTEKMCDFIAKVKTGSIVRVFLYIAHHQNYGTDGKTFGYRCSHKYLRTVLGMDKSTLWDAITFLKDKFLVHVGKVEGYTEFMVNPDYVTIGQDKKSRRVEWNRRWAETWANQKITELKNI